MTVSRETAIGIGVTGLAIVAMAFDHLDLLGAIFLPIQRRSSSAPPSASPWRQSLSASSFRA
jgi:hypothetical protein